MKRQHRKKKIPTPCTDEETEVGMKVVAIMQTITEDLDDSGKRAWRKMLSTSDAAGDTRKNNVEETNP